MTAKIFIIILLVVTIALILGIALYDYNPTPKKVPNKVEAYALSEDVQNELNETIKTQETQSIIFS